MTLRPTASRPNRIPVKPLLSLAFAMAILGTTGCQDGPLYAVKTVNPFFTAGEWKRDKDLGVTDHERREQLDKLSVTIGKLPEDRQQFWTGHLQKILENDESPEMRRLVAKAAGNLDSPQSMRMIETALDDPSVKVRMEACRSLSKKSGDDATRLLVAAIGTDTSEDVKHSAMAALGNHSNKISVDALRIALSDRNPATRGLAMESLRESTGKDYGNDPQVWIAALDGKPTPEAEVRFADRLRDLF